MSNRIYNSILRSLIKDTPYIPKKIKSKEDIKVNARYACIEQNISFKIEEIIEVDHQDYYQIKLISNNRQAVIPYEEKFHYYELLTDRTNISSIDNIINSKQPYFGSEIKYWFYKQQVDLDSEKYQCFKPLLSKSDCVLSDKRVYYLRASYDKDKDIYYNAKATML